MKRCPITYEIILENETYSLKGLRLLSRGLTTLHALPFSAEELRQEASLRAEKMSIQGVQPKLSAVLNIKNNCFDIVDNQGKYILKPSLSNYPEVPANEDLTMKLATLVGIEVPLHGLLYDRDNTFTYFIQRFDRTHKKNKVAVEDFAQLSGSSRETKYDFSMEKIIPIIETYCTFPVLEKHKLLVRILFNFLIGNEDMHLKNFSLITREGKTELAPAYDFLNTTILLSRVKEELALPLKGKKSNFTSADFIQYYAQERLLLKKNIVQETVINFQSKIPLFLEWIDKSFLSASMKSAYKDLLSERAKRLFFPVK